MAGDLLQTVRREALDEPGAANLAPQRDQAKITLMNKSRRSWRMALLSASLRLGSDRDSRTSVFAAA